MRHSYFAQSYSFVSPSLEVTEAELLDRPVLKGWSCETIAQMRIPQANPSQIARPEASLELRHYKTSRRFHSVDPTLLCAPAAERRYLISA